MATHDQSVENLRRFLVQVATATSAVGQVAAHVEEETHALDGLEKRAAEEGDGLTGELVEARSALDTGAAEVTQALVDLGTTATQGQQALGGAQDQVEQAATDLEEKVRTALGEMEDAHSSLTHDGFEVLGHALDEAERELHKEVQETTQALNEMETAVQAMETEAEAAWDETGHEIESATAELGDGASKLEAEGDEGVQALEAAAGEMESRCTSLEGDLELIYDILVSGVDAQGQEWDKGVQEAAQDGLTFVTEGQQERLDAPAATLETEALGALDHEYQTVAALLDVASATADALTPLAHELVPCEAVVAQVGELMNALAG